MSIPRDAGDPPQAGQQSVLDLEGRLRGDLDSLGDFAAALAAAEGPAHGRRLPGGAGGGDDQLALPGRINADPATVDQGLARLVLTLIELIRRLLEKQAIRRMDAGSLSEDEIERMGETLLRLEQKMEDLKASFGLQDDDLTLNLGPLADLVAD